VVRVNTSVQHGCLGVVLAGGLSSRMGQDKALLTRNNHSMLSFSKQILMDSGISNVVVSGNNHDIPDLVEQNGPVGGIFSVLARFPQINSLLILPVDLPFITAKALAKLRVKGELSQKATFFQSHNIPLYLPNNAYLELYLKQAFNINDARKAVNTAATSRFVTKGPSIKALINCMPHQAISCDDEKTLFNTNTPEQWQQASKQLNFEQAKA